MLRPSVIGLVVALTAPLAASAADGGAGEGLPKKAVAAVVRAHLGALKACYEAPLRKTPDMQGEIDVAWEVEKDGRVSDTRVTHTTMNRKSVEDCIVAQVASWRFPTASERTPVDRFPFIFKNDPSPAPPTSAPKR